MSDDRKPRAGSMSDAVEERSRRQQSQTERDIAGFAARRDRQRTPGAVPIFTTDEVTGQHEGEDLARARARRPTPDRLAHLENKHDALSEAVHETRVEVANISGKLAVLPELVDLIKGKNSAQQAAHAEDNKTRRAAISARAKVIIAIVGLASAALGILATSLAGCT